MTTSLKEVNAFMYTEEENPVECKDPKTETSSTGGFWKYIHSA